MSWFKVALISNQLLLKVDIGTLAHSALDEAILKLFVLKSYISSYINFFKNQNKHENRALNNR